MSKIKEALLKEQDNLMEYYFGFYDWLEKYHPSKLSDDEIGSIQKECEEKLILSNLRGVNRENYKLDKKEEM